MRRTILFILAIMTLLTACRDEDIIAYPISDHTGDTSATEYAGLYVLNEGNMGSNKCTLDYLDLTTGIYTRNIYPTRNPSQVMELGDVGNDIKVYGSSLWMVVNMSNKVEVADARTAVSRGHVDIPNCRSLAFDGKYVYVSAYVGEIGKESVVGGVYKVDTTSLQIVGKVNVGYQPDELTVSNGKLYVVNSGGYEAVQGRGYDRRVSVINLTTFSLERHIDVAPNLALIRADRHGRLWVASRGDYMKWPARLYLLDKDKDGRMAVTDSINTAVSGMCLEGDSIYYYGAVYGSNGKASNTFGIIDVNKREIVSTHLIEEPADNPIHTAYGILVHPATHDIYIMDATNFVSSGKLYCFDRNGKFKWTTWTGDIPGHAAWLPHHLGGTVVPSNPDKPSSFSPYIQAVDEYMPAPGQFVNTMPECTADDTPASVAEKCTQLLAGNNGGLVTLGGYGGYITFHFDHSITNVKGERDIYIKGNCYDGNSEPGIVMVSKDVNHNGIPDDPWYEIAGSADTDSAGLVTYGYEITYTPNPLGDISWTDNHGITGTIERNTFHAQEYFPLWHQGPLSFRGTLLPKNGINQSRGSQQYWWLSSLRHGYADNYANTDTLGCSIDISWAVDEHRQPVDLDCIDFIRVYNGENQKCGWLGETSTEIAGAEDLHLDASITGRTGQTGRTSRTGRTGRTGRTQ